MLKSDGNSRGHYIKSNYIISDLVAKRLKEDVSNCAKFTKKAKAQGQKIKKSFAEVVSAAQAVSDENRTYNKNISNDNPNIAAVTTE